MYGCNLQISSYAKTSLLVPPARFADIPRHGIAGQPGAKLGHQRDAGREGHLEMRRPGHRVQLVQVIRHYPQIDQPLAQLGQHVGPIVDAPQQDRLVQHGNAGIDQPPEGTGHVAVDLGGMVHLHHHDGSKAGCRESRKSARPSPAGGSSPAAACESAADEGGGFAANSPPSRANSRVGQHERIAAAEDHLVDRAIRGDAAICIVHPLLRGEGDRRLNRGCPAPPTHGGTLNRYGKCRRKQYRQWTAHDRPATIKIRP